MARPREALKPKWASAYVEKCCKEAERLQQRLASILRHDMLLLLDNGHLSDIDISTPSKISFNAHKCLIKARSPKVWNDVLKNPEKSSTVLLNLDQPQHIFQLLRFIYGEDNITAIDELVNQCHDSSEEDLSPQGCTQDDTSPAAEEKTDLPACCPLGSDILHMYLQGDDHDVSLKINSTSFRAHKCILCARSGYFAAMLSGPWSESNSDEIELIGVSADSMQLILLYMYGAVPNLDPSECNITHILAAADMYGLCGLMESVAHALRRYYCHFFHKPCTDCANGVLFTLPLACTYGLEDLWRKALKWTAKHFARVWSTKQFSLLPQEIQTKCVETCVEGINFKTVVEVVMECDCLLGSLGSVRWSDPVIALANRVMDECRQYLRYHLLQVINSAGFILLGTTMALGLSFLGEVLCDVIQTLPLENAFKAYVAINDKAQVCHKEDCTWNKDFKDLITLLDKAMTLFMQMNINHLLSCSQWHSVLTPQMQTVLKEGAHYVSFNDAKPSRKPALSSNANVPLRKPAKPSSIKGQTDSKHQKSKNAEKKKSPTQNLPEKKSPTRNGSQKKLSTLNGSVNSKATSYKHAPDGGVVLSRSNVQSFNALKKPLCKKSDALLQRIESSSSVLTFYSTAVTVNSDLESPSSDFDIDPEPLTYTDSLLFPLVWTFEVPTCCDAD